MPKNIDIITILPKGFNLTLSDIQNSDESIRFLYLDDESLAQEIEKSDIQIVIIDRDIKKFTLELYEEIDKEFLSVYFNPIKLNEISSSEVRTLRGMQKLKSFVDNPKSFDVGQIKEDLDTKIKKFNESINSTYLEAIKIKKYFSIIDMEIEDLKGKKEIYFVGENGDGKTVLLQAIILAFKYNKYSDLAKLYIGEEQEKNGIEIYTKDTQNSKDYIEHKNLQNIFAYGINRNKTNNKESEKSLGYSAIFDTSSITRTTYLREPETLLLNKSNIIKKFIPKIEDLMGNKLKILITNKVEFQEINGDTIKFDMLSEGYKSTLIWLCDLLSRLMENQLEVTELEKFQAIVLIDEVDLYLHPKWKYDFMNKLREIFDGIQFIMTTHSVVTLLGAREDAVFYKIYKENGETKISDQIPNRGYTNNTLISSPLFNLDTMTSRHYDKRKLSEDDYVYELIHEVVSQKIKEDVNLNEDAILKLIEEEFDKHEKN